MTTTPKLTPNECAQHVTATIRTVLSYDAPTVKTLVHLQSNLIKFEETQGYKISESTPINKILWAKITEANGIIYDNAEIWAKEKNITITQAINSPEFEAAMKPKIDAMIENSSHFKMLEAATPKRRTEIYPEDRKEFVEHFLKAIQGAKYDPKNFDFTNQAWVDGEFNKYTNALFGSTESYGQIRFNAAAMMAGGACEINGKSIAATDLSANVTVAPQGPKR